MDQIVYTDNIVTTALQNVYYRQVNHTSKHTQSVYMSLEPGEDIPLEQHDGEQIIIVIYGTADITINGEQFRLNRLGDMIIIPPYSKHYVNNGGDDVLKLFTIYTPPEHSPGHKDMNQP